MIGLKESLQWLLPHKWLNLSEVERWMSAQDGSDERFGLLLAFGFGAIQVFGWADRVETVVMRLIASVILGPIVGLVLYYIGGGLLNGVLKLFGGTGNATATRSGVFLTSVPVLWVMALTALLATTASAADAYETIRQPVAGSLALVFAAAAVWHIVLLVVVLSKAHRITGVRVFTALLLADLILSGPSLACAWPIGYVL